MILAAPATILTAAVSILAILVCLYTGVRVGRARVRFGVAAPAMSGHPIFERTMRVQMNTMEQFVVFIPALWLSAMYFHYLGWLTPVMGLVWCIGRLLYAHGYIADPEKRHIGFAVTAGALFVLLILAAIGIVSAFVASTSA